LKVVNEVAENSIHTVPNGNVIDLVIDRTFEFGYERVSSH